MGGGNDHGRGGSVTRKKMLRAVDEHTTASDTSARGFGCCREQGTGQPRERVELAGLHCN